MQRGCLPYYFRPFWSICCVGGVFVGYVGIFQVLPPYNPAVGLQGCGCDGVYKGLQLLCVLCRTAAAALQRLQVAALFRRLVSAGIFSRFIRSRLQAPGLQGSRVSLVVASISPLLDRGGVGSGFSGCSGCSGDSTKALEGGGGVDLGGSRAAATTPTFARTDSAV